MIRRNLTVASLLALTAWLAAGLCPGPARAQQEYALSYQWGPGQRLSYSVYVVGKIETSGQPTQEIKIRHDSVWEVLEADQVGDRYLITEQAKNYVGSDVDLRSFGVLPADEPIQRSLDSFGRASSVSHYPEGSRYHFLPLTFDPNPVAVGKTWTITPRLHMPLGGLEIDTTAQVEYTLDKVLSHYKSQTNFCALIRVHGLYEYKSPDGGAGLTGEWEGKVVFDLVDRIVVDYKIKDFRREWRTADNWNRTITLETTAIEQKFIP